MLPQARSGILRVSSLYRAAHAMSSQELVAQHHPGEKMFCISLENGEQAVLTYENVSEDLVDLQHTEVPDSMRGKGVAKILAKEALGHFSSEKKMMKLTCWYLKKYAAEHPDPAVDPFVKE